MTPTKASVHMRPAILRHFYETSFGAPSPTPESYAGATPSEYVRLYRIHYPDARARSALASSPTVLGLRTKDVPDDITDPPPAEKSSWELVDKTAVDLGDPSWKDRRVQFRRCALSSTGSVQLESLWAHECDASETRESIAAASNLRELRLTGCTRAAETLVLRSCRSTTVRVESERPQFDLASVSVDGLLEIDCRAPALINPRAMGRAALRSATLVHLSDAAALRDALKSSTTSLEYLCFSAAAPVTPDQLPDLPSLRRIQVPANADHRNLWIDWATRHPDIACVFRDPSVFASMTGLALAGEFAGVGIYADNSGRQPGGYVAFGPLIETLGLPHVSYDALEHELKAALRKRKIAGVRVSSESDGLVIKAKSREALEQAIAICADELVRTRRE